MNAANDMIGVNVACSSGRMIYSACFRSPIAAVEKSVHFTKKLKNFRKKRDCMNIILMIQFWGLICI